MQQSLLSGLELRRVSADDSNDDDKRTLKGTETDE